MKLEKFPKKIGCLLLFLFCTTYVVAQENKDSLDFYILKLKNENLLELDSVVYYYKKSRGFADIYKQIYLLRKEANSLRKRGVEKAAYRRISKALELAKTNNLKVTEGIIYLDVSHHFYHFNQYEPAYKAIFKSKEILESISDEELNQYNSHNTIGFTRGELLDPVLFNIGTIALDNDDLEKAEQHFYESLNYAIKQGDKQGIIDAKLNLASLEHNRKKYKESNKAFDQLLAGDSLLKSDESLIYYNKALNYIEIEDFIQAEGAIVKAIELSVEIGDSIQLIDLYYHKSRIEKAFKNFSNEKQLLEKSLQGAEKIDDHLFKVKLFQALATCEIATNNLEQATNWYQKMIALRDSLGEQDNDNLYKTIELENKLSTEEKQNEQILKIIDSEKSNARLFKVSFLLGSLLIIVLVYALIYSKNNYNKKIQLAKEKSKLEKATIKHKRLQDEVETRMIQDGLNAKKRELLLALMFTKKHKEKLKLIGAKIDKLSGNSIITKDHLNDLKAFIVEKSIELDTEEDVQKKIVNTHKDFFNKLLVDFPKLTQTELKILAYIRVNMNTKDIAQVQNVSIDAVRKMRYRIRKKLELTPKQSLEKFILQYH